MNTPEEQSSEEEIDYPSMEEESSDSESEEEESDQEEEEANEDQFNYSCPDCSQVHAFITHTGRYFRNRLSGGDNSCITCGNEINSDTSLVGVCAQSSRAVHLTCAISLAYFWPG